MPNWLKILLGLILLLPGVCSLAFMGTEFGPPIYVIPGFIVAAIGFWLLVSWRN